MLQIAACVTSITLLELGDCFRGRYRRLVRMSRISGAGKLTCDRNAGDDEASYKLHFSHVVSYEMSDLFHQSENLVSGLIKDRGGVASIPSH